MKTKRCTSCGKTKLISEMGLDHGKIGAKCKACNVLQVIKYRKRLALTAAGRKKIAAWRKQPDIKWKANNKEKYKAHMVVSNAVIHGYIVRPERCSICKVKCHAHGHHEDYSKPLLVVWLCHKCHCKKHPR